MARTRTSRLKLWRWSDDTDPQMRTDFDTDNEQLELLAALASNGTRAARPAPGVRDRLYFATDEQILYYDSGAAWYAVVTKASMPADTVYLTGAQTLTGKVLSGSSNTFTNIPDSAIVALSASKIAGILAKAKLPADTVYGAYAIETGAAVLTAASGWSVNSSTRAQISGRVVALDLIVARTGGALSPVSSGNFVPDITVATVDSSWRPTDTWWGNYVGTATSGGVLLSTAGALTITDAHPGSTIDPGDVLRMSATFIR